MSCEQLETTVAWMYGEGPEEHAEHVFSCETCSAALEEHEAAMAVVAPVVAGLKTEVRGEVVVGPWRRRRVLGVAVVLLAAAAAIAMAVSATRMHSATTPAREAAPSVVDVFDGDDVDAALDALDDDLDALSSDLEVL